MKEETKGLYLAVLLSILIIFVVNYFMPTQQMVDDGVAPGSSVPEVSSVNETGTEKKTSADDAVVTAKTPQDIVKNEKRITDVSGKLVAIVKKGADGSFRIQNKVNN